MDDTLKFYLLAELNGWNCSAYAFRYSQKLKDCEAYRIIESNIPDAQKHLSGKSQGIVAAYNGLSFEQTTLKDVFICETTLNYLALNSFPEFYINPLAIDPNYDGRITTIGQLYFDYQGAMVPLNDIILDKTVKDDEKISEVNKQLDFYLYDMGRIVEASVSRVSTRAFGDPTTKRMDVVNLLEEILFVVLNGLLVLFFTLPNPAFRQCLYFPDAGRILSYVGFLYPILLFAYDLIFVSYHSYRAKISEPYNFARRFLARNPDKVYDDIRQEREKLGSYIQAAITTNLVLKNDIRDFSKLSSSYVDFQAVLNVSSLKKKKMYILLRSLSLAAETLAGMMAVITLVVFFLALTFNTTI